MLGDPGQTGAMLTVLILIHFSSSVTTTVLGIAKTVNVY